MNETDPVGTDKDRALWARAKNARPPAGAVGPASPPPVFDEELAAWLDGRASPELAARVEARLAADPALLTASLDMHGALREAAVSPAPARLETRAKALVGFDTERLAAAGGGRALSWLMGWRRRVEFAAVATLFLAVAAGGFTLGGGMQEAVAQDRAVDQVFASLFDSGDTDAFGEPGGQQ
ncbi:MAG: hypothetical protein JNL07_04025 [Rhodospirillales bacterium]|nr:hypothetical protein [Rhodospirillales bacterium]